MGRAHQSPHTASSYLLQLIAVLQFPLSSAHPFVNPPYQNFSTTASANIQQPSAGAAVPEATSVADVKTTSFTSNPATPNAETEWQPNVARNEEHVVWEIGDGQIQAPYETFAGEVTAVSGTSTLVEATTFTRYSRSPAWGSGGAPSAWSGNGWGTRTWNSAWQSAWSERTTPEIGSQTQSPGTDSLVGASSSATPSSPSSTSTTPATLSEGSSVRPESSSSPSTNIASMENSMAVSSSTESSSTSGSTGQPTSSNAATVSSSTMIPSTTAALASSLASSTLAVSTLLSTQSVTITITTSVPDSALTTLTTSAIQSVTSTLTVVSTGSYISSLETSGRPTAIPFLTSIATATSTLSLANPSSYSSLGQTANATVTSIAAENIFQAIATDAPPSQITATGNHPVPTLGIQKQQDRLETNKFYANFFLGDQTAGTWTHPYSVAWGAGAGESGSYGLAITHTERDQFGNTSAEAGVDAGQIKYFGSPIGLQDIIMSAAELGNGTTLTTDSLEAFSVNVNLANSSGTNVLTFPLLQGMGFVTGVYNSGTPLIQSGLGITNVTYCGAVDNGITYKYRASVMGGTSWLIYVTPSDEDYNTNSFTLLDAENVQGPSNFNGYVQIAKLPTNGGNSSETAYDSAAGVYATSASISGSVSGQTGTYTLEWTKGGDTSRTLLMWALPHHVQSFSDATAAGLTSMSLVTTTKGYATAISGDSWTLEEPDLPIDLGFAPWSPETGTIKTVSSATVDLLNSVAYTELNEDVFSQANTSSIYYDGKALAKFATICYTAADIASNSSLAISGLKKLQDAFAFHVNNLMPYPIVYDDVWGGIVSICSYEGGDTGCDFGNTYYNDHHFHYGYYVYAAAVIGYLNSTWLETGTNKAWVNTLVRDYANSITDDPYFPFARMFDWYHGHSWAHGITETADGKDQESSSEDTMASYAIKQWGNVIGDINMEARGNLMLAIHARSLQNYYLYTADNTVQPAAFIGNKVAGILFENKLDHVTYFGDVAAYIQGIHMLPLLPHTPLIRTKTFVQEEWAAYFANGTGISPVWNITGGWRGIIEGNQMFIDPTASYDFFTGSGGTFNQSYLDSGASQTWYLAFSAALGGDAGTSSKARRDSIGDLAGKVSDKVSRAMK